MAGSQTRAKRPFISLSSSSEEEEDDDDDDEEEEEEIDEEEEEEEEEEEGSVQSSSDDGSDEEEESDSQEESEDEDEGEKNLDDESLSNKVDRLLQEGNDLQTLTLQNCKAYLRKHGLRIAGTKAVCIQRIKEHWRIKDGNGEALYPRSSFVIHCTGDVCKGDVVLFKQKVYEKFNKVRRSGCLLGMRTIAGRVVKESYGAARQQHTFTVEVLWSRGIKKLPPLFPLLVKGRNLYKLKTFRRRWRNEAERSKVLAEKHKRGTAARLARERKKMKKTWSAGTKHQKHDYKAKCADGCGKTISLGYANSTRHHGKAPAVGEANLDQITKSRAVKAARRHQKHTYPCKDRVLTFQLQPDRPLDIYQSHMDFRHRSAPFCFFNNELGSTSATMPSPFFRPYANLSTMPASQYQGLHYNAHTSHAYSNPRYELEPSNLNHFPGMRNNERPIYPFQRWKRGL